MKNNPRLLLYLLRGIILILSIWIVFELFSSPVNAQEQQLYKEIATTQYNAKDIIAQTSRFTYRDYSHIFKKRLTNSEPILLALDSINHFCNQTLDSLQDVFAINSLPFEKITELVNTYRDNLNQRIYHELLIFQTRMPSVEDEEIEDFYHRLPSKRKTFNRKNHILLKSLSLSEIEQIRNICTNFLSKRVSSNTLHYLKQPVFVQTAFPLSPSQHLKIVLVPDNFEMLSLEDVKVNGQFTKSKDKIYSFETIPRDTSTQTLIVEGNIYVNHSQFSIPLRDTFTIHPINN